MRTLFLLALFVCLAVVLAVSTGRPGKEIRYIETKGTHQGTKGPHHEGKQRRPRSASSEEEGYNDHFDDSDEHNIEKRQAVTDQPGGEGTTKEHDHKGHREHKSSRGHHKGHFKGYRETERSHHGSRQPKAAVTVAA